MSAFRDRVRAREILIGPLLTLSSPQVAEIFAQLGFDWAWIDLEHTPLQLDQAQQLIVALGGRAGSVIRVPWNDPVYIKQSLDLGCNGVLVPQVRTAEEAKRAVAACKYPPAGVRSVGIARAQSYGMKLQECVLAANEQITVMLQIEHIDAVPHIDAILEVPGVDAIVIGPYDLSASMGRPGEIGHPDVATAIDTVATACQAHGISWGAFCPDAPSAKRQIARGATVVALGTDTMHLCRGASAALAELRQVNS